MDSISRPDSGIGMDRKDPSTMYSLPPPPGRDTVAMLQYSSGSTGQPKGVVIRHGDMMANLAGFYETANFSSASVEISWLPHFHDMGLDLAYLITVYSGCRGYFTGPHVFLHNPSLWLVAIGHFGGTHTAVPNFAMELVIKRGYPEILDLGTLQCISVGAEPTHHQTLETFHRHFRPFGLKSVYNSIYGLAEHVCLLTSLPVDLDCLYRRSGDWVSCGPPLRGVTVRVVHPETREPLAEDGETVGEIWATSAPRPQGYWNQLEASRSTFHAELVPSDGQTYLRTGDLGFIRGGEVFITGRLKDLIIINGRNIYPNDVEYHIETKFSCLRPGCSAAYSVATTCSEDIGIVAEIVDIKKYAPEKLFELGTAVVTEVAKEFQAQVSTVSMISPRTIPKTTSGKICRKQCKEDAESDLWTPVYKWSLSDLITNRLTKGEASPWFYPEYEDRSKPHIEEVVDSAFDILVQQPIGSLPMIEEPLDPVSAESKKSEKEETPPAGETQPLAPPGLQAIQPSSVVTAIGNVLGKQMHEKTNFWALGCDSVKAAQIMEEIFVAFGLEVPVHHLYSCKTPTEVCAMLLGLTDSLPVEGVLGEATAGVVDGAVVGRRDSVAIVGMSCRFPGAHNLSQFWDLLMSNADAAIEIPLRGDDSPLRACFTTAADVFDHGWFGLSERKAFCLDPNHSLLLHTVHSALVNSGYDVASPLKKRIGVFVGMSGSECAVKEGVRAEDLFPETHPHAMAANLVSHHFGLTGPSFAIDASCSSSFAALAAAMNALLLEQCEAAIVGGVSVMLVPEVVQANRHAGTSRGGGGGDGGGGGKSSCAFSATAGGSGYLRGEGCGVVVLKLESAARRHGDRVLACIRSCVTNHNGSSATSLTAPSSAGQTEVMLSALEAAHLSPSDVAFVEAHAVGAPIADIIEAEAIASVYKRGEGEIVYVSSVKGNIGHLEAASGMAGLIKAVLSLERNVIPAVVNVDRLHPMLPHSIAIPTHPVQLLSKGNSRGSPFMLAAGITTNSLGGSLAHAIIQQASPLPDMKCTTVGVVVALETKSPPGISTFENALMEMRAIEGFAAAEKEVYSQIVTFFGQCVLSKMDSVNPVLLEFVFAHCLLKTLAASGVFVAMVTSMGPLSEVLAAVHAGVLSLRDGILVVLSRMNPELQREEFRRTVTARPPSVPFYSPTQCGLLPAGEPCAGYAATLTRAVAEQEYTPRWTTLSEVLRPTAHLMAVATVAVGSSRELAVAAGRGDDEVHLLSLTTVPTMRALRQGMLELRQHCDHLRCCTLPGPLETTLLPGVHLRFPLRRVAAAMQMHSIGEEEEEEEEEEGSIGETADVELGSLSHSPPAPRRRSSSIYSSLAMKVLAESSSSSSTASGASSGSSSSTPSSITDITMDMNSDQRLLFLTELVCLSAQEALDTADASVLETQNLVEVGMTAEMVPQLLDRLHRRTGVFVSLTEDDKKELSPVWLATAILKQLFPGVAPREEKTTTITTAPTALAPTSRSTEWKDIIKASLYKNLSQKCSDLPPIEEAVKTDVFALGIESLVLTQMKMYIDDVYGYRMSMSEMTALSTLEAMAATVAMFLENTKISVYPRLTKEGYSIHPPMTEIMRMVPNFLSKISSFCIMREGIGKIEFIGNSDLTGIDLDKTVIIDEGEVTVYPTGTSIPPHGCGLNRPAIVTFRNIHPRKSSLEGYDRMERRLKKNCEEKRLTFVAYDFTSGDFVFKVNGF